VLSVFCTMCTISAYSGTTGQVVHMLPEGEPVFGVASLANEVYVLRCKERDQVEVYDTVIYRLQRCLTVLNACGFTDMTACEHCHCVYIADHIAECIHRLGAQDAATQWPVNDEPASISVNAAHNLLVTCYVVRKIKEFSSDGNLLRELILPDNVINPWQAIRTLSGQYIACHGARGDAVHRVCKMSADGREIVQSHGGKPGSAIGQYNVSIHLAVDDYEFVFVADLNNRRVTLLSQSFGYIREVVCRDDLKWKPRRLCLGIHRRRLYVADSDVFTAGRVVVFDV